MQYDPQRLYRLTTLTAMFPWAALSTLRGDAQYGPAAVRLSPMRVRDFTVPNTLLCTSPSR